MEINDKIKKELTDDEISKVTGGTRENYGMGKGIIPLREETGGITRWYDEANDVTFEYKCPDCGWTMHYNPCRATPTLGCECGIGDTDPSMAIKNIIGPGKIL